MKKGLLQSNSPEGSFAEKPVFLFLDVSVGLFPVQRIVKCTQQFFLFRCQLRGHLHNQCDIVVASLVLAVKIRYTLSAEPDLGIGLGSGL